MNFEALRAGQSIISPFGHLGHWQVAIINSVYGITMNEARIATHVPMVWSFIRSALINELLITSATVTAAS